MDSSDRDELSYTRDGFTSKRAGGCLGRQNALATVMGGSLSCEGPRGLVSPFSHLAWGSRLPAGTPGWHRAEELLNVFALLMKWVGDRRESQCLLFCVHLLGPEHFCLCTKYRSLKHLMTRGD